MNKKLFLLFLVLLPRLLIPSSALSESLWIVGYVSPPVTEEIYGSEHYWQFSFVVGDTNRTDLASVGTPITVICWTEIGAVTEQAYYNFSGAVNDVQVDEKPEGVFIVSEIHGSATEPTDWDEILKLIIEIFSFVTRGIASTIAQLVAVATGGSVIVPEWVVTLALVVVLFASLLKYAGTIGVVMLIVLCFLLVGGGASLLRTLVWA